MYFDANKLYTIMVNNQLKTCSPSEMDPRDLAKIRSMSAEEKLKEQSKELAQVKAELAALKTAAAPAPQQPEPEAETDS